jgi:hypothetical protein
MSRPLAVGAPGEALALPASTVTSTMLVLGGKGMGKSNFGTVVCEECAAAGLRFAVLDPIGVWWGLQHDAAGSGPGIPVLVLGGVHGDLPLEPRAGAVVADLVADEEVDVVVDISRHPSGQMWAAAEQVRFVAEFTTRLYERQGERRRPVLLVLEEAGRFVPQTIPHGNPDLARCVGAIERLVELGRNVGIGALLITQRSARIAKAVAELADALVAFRTVGPRSIDAIVDWFGEHIDKAAWRGLIEQVRSLPVGSALIVSPGWLALEGAVRIRARRTFDSSATPTGADARPGGRDAAAVATAAKPDLGLYRARMAETIAAAEAADPRALRARVADLERQLAAAAAAAPRTVEVERVVEVPVLPPGHADDLRRAAERVDAVIGLAEKLQDLGAVLRQLAEAGPSAAQPPPAREPFILGVARRRAAERLEAHRAAPGPAIDEPPGLTERDARAARGLAIARAAAVAPVAPKPNGAGAPLGAHLSAGERALLELVARNGPLTPRALAIVAGLNDAGGYFRRTLAGLRRRDYVEGGEELRPTNAGLEALGGQSAALAARPSTTAEILDRWRARLGVAEMRLLELLVAAYPRWLGKEEAAAAMNPERPLSTAGGFYRRLVAKLRRNALVDDVGGQLRASELLRPG